MRSGWFVAAVVIVVAVWPLPTVQQQPPAARPLSRPPPHASLLPKPSAGRDAVGAVDKAASHGPNGDERGVEGAPVSFLQDITRDMYLRKHRRSHRLPAALHNADDAFLDTRHHLLLQTSHGDAGGAGGGAGGAARPVVPSRPGSPATPAKPILIENIAGPHIAMMSKAVEAVFDRTEKRIMEGQFVPFMYDPTGAQDGSGRGFDDPLGQLPSETNLCFALLESWLRSCAEPQIMLELTVTTTSRPRDTTHDHHNHNHNHNNDAKHATSPTSPPEQGQPPMGEAALSTLPQDQQGVERAAPVVDVSQLPLEMLPNTTADMRALGKVEAGVRLRNYLLEDPGFIPALLESRDVVEGLVEAAQHPLTLPHLLSSPQGQTILSHCQDFVQSHPDVRPLLDVYVATLAPQGPASRPMAPFIGQLLGMLAAIVSLTSSITGGLKSVADGMDSANNSLKDAMQKSDVLSTLWSLMRMDKGPPGIRPGFVQPEVYDARGPYGPEPFPFQTPGAEKCRRFLVSYVHKCAVN